MPKLFQSIRRKAIHGDGMKKYLAYALGEIVLVIVGILVALQINNWNESRKEKQQQNAILSSIKTELETNLMLLEEAHERRKSFFRSLDSLTNQVPDSRKQKLYSEIPNNERLPHWTGAAPITLNGSMFEAAKYSDALAKIDVEVLQSLSNTYNKQQITNTIGNSLINKFFDLDADRTILYDDIIGFMWRMQEEFFGSQFLLMEDYKTSIALIDENIK